MWKNSGFDTIEEIRFSAHSLHYSLVDHINEVINIGLRYIDLSCEYWDDSFTSKLNKNEFIKLALFHDVDKMMFLSQKAIDDNLENKITHGMLAALLMSELKISDRIISIVAYHSPKINKNIIDPLAMVLHYSDLFSADHIFMLANRRPFYYDK